MASSEADSVYDQPDADSVKAQFDSYSTPSAVRCADAARTDVLAFTDFPKQPWRQVWQHTPNERLSKEIPRRTDVVGI